MAGYIGSKASVVSSGVERKKTYAITTSTTSLTGLNYTVGKVHVFQNGVRLLDGTDYTATNGTSITLTVAAQSGDNVVVVSQASFQLSEHYTSAEADAEFVTKTGDTVTGNLSFGDNDKAIFGAGSDLQIFHDGNNSFINELGTGNLTIKSSNVLYLMSGDSETYATFTANGASTLYHNNAAKLATTATGIDVTGTVTSDGLTVQSNNNLDIHDADNHVSGRLRNVSGSNNALTIEADPNNSASGSFISLKIDTSEKMRIDSSGNVGIGTSSPATPLAIHSALSSGGAIAEFRSTGNTNATLDIRADGTGDSRIWFDLNGATPFVIGVDNSDGDKFKISGNSQLGTNDRLTIDSSGKVGIGTSSPENPLHISNNSATSQMLVQGNTNDASIKFNKSGQTFTVGIDATDNSFRIADNPTLGTNDRLVIDSSGNVLVGGHTSTHSPVSNGGSGVTLMSNGQVLAGGEYPAYFNRENSDGDIIVLRKDGSAVGSIGNDGGNMYIGKQSGLGFQGNDIISPNRNGVASDNTIDLGQSSARFDDIYATNGTIQTSDFNEKQDIASLTATEMLVGKRISALFKTFRWKDSVAEKGDNARTHTGVIAQDVQAAFTAEGLDAGNYALFISSTWWETQTEVPAVEAVTEVIDEDGNVTTEAVEAKDAYTRIDHYHVEAEAPEGSTKRTRLGIRYPELLSFVAAYNEQRFASIEARLTALEA